MVNSRMNEIPIKAKGAEIASGCTRNDESLQNFSIKLTRRLKKFAYGMKQNGLTIAYPLMGCKVECINKLCKAEISVSDQLYFPEFSSPPDC